MSTIKFESKDKLALLTIAACQVGIAWLMTFFELVYAPLPMFGAAVVAGFLFKGRPRQASVVGALAGLLGGFFSEYAYHLVRLQHVGSWAQLSDIEQFWLAIAEMLLYASLLSFFAAFFSWGTYREHTGSSEPLSDSDTNGDDSLTSVDIPMFKREKTDLEDTEETPPSTEDPQ